VCSVGSTCDRAPLLLAAVMAEVDRHADGVACRLEPAQEPGAGPRSGALLAVVAGVEMTPVPRRPAAATTVVTELLRWQPYGVRTDAGGARVRCARGARRLSSVCGAACSVVQRRHTCLTWRGACGQCAHAQGLILAALVVCPYLKFLGASSVPCVLHCQGGG